MAESSTALEPEKVVWTGRTSQMVNAVQFVVLTLVTLAVALLLARFEASTSYYAILIVPILLAAKYYLVTSSYTYTITTERIRNTHGVVTSTVDDMELYRVRDYEVSRPLAMRAFGLGNLIVVTSDRSTPTLVFYAIKDPSGVQDLLRTHVEQCRAAKGVRTIDADVDRD